MQIRSEWARRSLRAFDLLLQPVSVIEYNPRALPNITYNRLNERYRRAIKLAKLILRATSFDLRPGGVHSAAFLVDMNEVFENFVVTALREALKVSEHEFPQGASGKGFSLDRAERVRLEPDISWWEAGRCLFVGDLKYKRVNAVGIKHPDLYQLLAYTIAADVPAGLLIYAAGEGTPAAHEVVNVGKTLEIVTLDLSGAPEEVLAQIEVVASIIRQQRRASRANYETGSQ